MKKTGRSSALWILVFAVLLTGMMTLVVSPVWAGEQSSAKSSPGAPVVYAVTSREKTGSGADGEKEWKYDYIALNDDGTGIFLYNEAAFSIRWTQDGDAFSFTDHLGNQFTGTKNGSTIAGDYGQYHYEFQGGDWTLPVYTLSPGNWGNGLAPVVDQAGVLDKYDMEDLTEKAQKLADQYDVGVYIVLLDVRDDFTWTGNIETLSEEIRSGYSIGIGSTEAKEKHDRKLSEDWKDSILLTVAFDCRKYDICVSGDYATWLFTDYGREKIRDGFVGEFQEDEWADGLYNFLWRTEKALKVGAKGHAMSFRYDTPGILISYLVPVLLALIFGFGITSVFRASMQNTQNAQNAAGYVAGNGINFTRREDRYIRTIVSRVYSPKESKSSGGGGGGGFSSSGSSHTSDSF